MSTNNPILNAAIKNFQNCLSSEFAEDFLEILLTFMSAAFVFNKDFRKNIKGFNGRYQFRSKDGHINVAAVFHDNRLEVREEDVAAPHITVLFKDGKALMGYLLSPKPDILGSMLRQEVSLDGNLNYLYKFAFMAKRLQLMASGAI